MCRLQTLFIWMGLNNDEFRRLLRVIPRFNSVYSGGPAILFIDDGAVKPFITQPSAAFDALRKMLL